LYLDLEEYLGALSERMSPEAVNIRIAQHTFEDLTIFRDPNGSVLYCSFAVAPFVDKIDINHDPEGRTYVTAFTVDKGVKIYSDPPVHYVGRYNEKGFGDIQGDGWEEGLREAGWEEDSIDKVKDYFARHPAVDF
jgi:hypothetical protein